MTRGGRKMKTSNNNTSAMLVVVLMIVLNSFYTSTTCLLEGNDVASATTKSMMVHAFSTPAFSSSFQREDVAASQSKRPAKTFLSKSVRDQAVPSQQHGDGVENMRRVMGSLIIGVLLSFQSTLGGLEVVPPANAMMQDVSSIVVAEEVKTFDLSLPSYGEISNTKASVENTKSMALPPVPKSEKVDIRTKSSTPDSGSSSTTRSNKGFPMSSVLPSMGKSNTKKPSALKQQLIDQVDGGEAAKGPEITKEELKTVDLTMPSYSESTASKEKSVFAL